VYSHARAFTGTTIIGGYGNRYRGINNFRSSRRKGDISQFFIKPDLSIANIEEDEAPIPTGALRKYVTIIIRNTGRGVAEYCDASLTLMQHKSNAKRLPSPKKKYLLWEIGEIYRTIGKKHGQAILNVAFSQDSFVNPGEKWSNLIGHIISQGIKSKFGILSKLDFSMNSITIKFSVL
jgi:hypothetical protein